MAATSGSSSSSFVLRSPETVESQKRSIDAPASHSRPRVAHGLIAHTVCKARTHVYISR